MKEVFCSASWAKSRLLKEMAANARPVIYVLWLCLIILDTWCIICVCLSKSFLPSRSALLGGHWQVKFFSQARGSKIARNPFAAVLHHWGAQEAANSQVCCLFILLSRSVTWQWMAGAGNWRKRLLGDRVLYEFSAWKDLRFFFIVWESGSSGNLKSNFFTSQRFFWVSYMPVHAMHICGKMKMLNFECAWRNCMGLALSLEGTEA